jgi:hypothetical protein
VALDCDINTGVPAETMKSLLVELVERAGASFSDLRAAKAYYDGAFYLTFNISDEEMSHLMAVFFPPMPNLAPDEKIAIAPGEISRDITIKYLLAVDKIVEDLRKKSVDSPNDYNKTALWHETAAKRIATMSTLNVDPRAVSYARGTVQLIGSIADSLRGVPIEYDALSRTAYAYRYVAPGAWHRPWWNRTWIDTNVQEVWKKQQETIAADQENRKKIWIMISNQRHDVMQAIDGKK